MRRSLVLSFIYLSLSLPSLGQALTCHSFLGPNAYSIAQHVNQYRFELSESRKKLEAQIFNSYGNIPVGLERTLYAVFNNPSRTDLQNQALKALKQSPFTHKMNNNTQIKIISLVQKKVVRPYMALLIGRYIEQIEYKNGIFSESAMNSIVKIVTHFITERGLLETSKILRFNKSRELQQEVQDFLTGKVSYQPYSINYKNPKGRLILSNAVLGFIFTFEDIIAYRPVVITANGQVKFF